MNKRIDLTNLGGFPFAQDTLKFMQDSYRGAFGGLAQMAGDKTIIAGVEVNGSNVTSGWIAYQGELIPFVGGVLGTDVIISETATDATFEDSSVFPTYYTKTATSGVGGAFPFSDLIRISALQNMWLPGDIKEKYVDNTYIAANFDVDGYGLNREKGWRILSKAYPAAAGKVMVNLDSADVDFDTVGKTGGEKKHTLTITEMPVHSHDVNDYGSEINPHVYTKGNWFYGDPGNGTLQGIAQVKDAGGGQAHNNLQPYFVVLKLIKL